MIALLSLFSFSPPLACSPPDSTPRLSNEEIAKLTAERIQRSDAIIDGIVTEKTDGRIFLVPIKIWKGRHLRRFYIENSGCGVFLSSGMKVRALLEGEANRFMMMAPLGDDRLKMQLHDNLIDAYLGQIRPPDFENGVVPYPPLP